jgi:16S rRNA (guanine527-N7)-methyltransferase
LVTLVEIFGANADRAIRYAELLATTGVERGLIGPGEVPRIWSRHMFNSSAVVPLIPQGAQVLDLGSGAGLPGIPVVLIRPDVRMTLLEPMARRVEFLRECLLELDLPEVAVHHGRAQEGPSQFADRVLARAVKPLPALVELAWPLTVPGGALLAIKGAKAAEEAAQLSARSDRSAVVHALTDVVGDPATVVEVRWTSVPPAPKRDRKKS